MTRAEYDTFRAGVDEAEAHAADADRRMAECVAGGDCVTETPVTTEDTSGSDTATTDTGSPAAVASGGVPSAPLMVPLPAGEISETVAYPRGTAASMGYRDSDMGGMMVRLMFRTTRPISLAIEVPGFGPSYIDPGTSRPVVTGGSLTAIPMFPAGTYTREIFLESPGRREITVAYYSALPGREAYPTQSCTLSMRITGATLAPYEINDSTCRYRR